MPRIPRALLPHTGVTFQPHLGKTGTGEKWGPAEPLAPRVQCVLKRRIVRGANGETAVSTAQVYMPGDPSTELPPARSKVTIYPGTKWERTSLITGYDLYDSSGAVPGTVTLFLE